MSRGQGRVYRPNTRGQESPHWWLDFTAHGIRHRAVTDPATTDRAEAFKQLRRRLAEHDAGPVVEHAPVTLAEFTVDHLATRRRAGDATAGWLDECQAHLERAIAFFGPTRELASIRVPDVKRWAAALKAAGLAGGTVRHHLNALSNLYGSAQEEEHVAPGYNPVALWKRGKPSAARAEARWLEVHDAALLLEAARHRRPTREDLALPFGYELLATFLLTGGRQAEVLGLEVADVSFDRATVTFRPNAWRRLKTATSHRSVPLWPQLREILERYLAARPPGRLLFPSYRTGRESMVDPRTILADAAERGGWKPEEITSKMFRHTYCAARLQTLDRGAPVSVYTVGKELGHGGDALVKRVYGHLGEVRHRADVVEYRVEQHTAKLGDRLAKVAASERQAEPTAKHVTRSGARSSVGQSIGLLSRGSEVRILPGASEPS